MSVHRFSLSICFIFFLGQYFALATISYSCPLNHNMAFRFPTPKILTEEQGKLMGWISNFKPADVKVKVENNKGEEALIGPFAPY